MYLGYVRVSTGKQTVENQMFAIEDFCARQNPPIHIDDWIIETASGMKHFDKANSARSSKASQATTPSSLPRSPAWAAAS